MNEDNKSIKIVNDVIKQSSANISCRKRNIIMRRHLSSMHPLTSVPSPLQVDTNESCSQVLSSPFKHFSDIKKVSPSKIHNSEIRSDMPATSLCNMCCRKDDACVNLQQNHATVVTVSDITRLPSWDIRQILASVCSRCLIYISAITESSSKLRMRCEQAMHTQAVVVAPPTPDTSPNNFLQVSATILDDAPGHSNIEQQQRNCYAPGYCDEAANDLHMPLATSSPCTHSPTLPLTLGNPVFGDISRSPSPNNTGHNSMLRIHYERSVSPLNTESGGGGKNKKRSYQRIQVIPVQMICNHCNRAYWRKDYYRKHMRRCSAKFRYAKSVIPQRARSISRLELDAISVVSELSEQTTIHQQPRIFRCNVCTVTVNNITKLRQHKRIHLPHYFCDICNGEFTSQNEFEFHRAQCTAKMEVFEKALTDAKIEVNSSISMSTRRKTRSLSRALSVAPSVAPSTIASRKKVKTSSKRNGLHPEVAKQTEKEEHRPALTNSIKKDKSVYSDASRTIDLNKNNSDDGNESEDDSDDVSEVDTLYSKRLSLTNHWVEEHSISSHSQLSQGDNYINDSVEDIPFPSLKEYDLYLLERLKHEVNAHCVTCFVPDCRFSTATLNEMMVHDYMHHYKKPWFYCHKCGFCFTSKVFLDYHLDLQNKGRYVCYKCGGHFEYQHQLDRHLIQHSRLVSKGGEKYICHFCNFRFLDEDKLLKHCHYENHHWNKERHTIEIDHSMTISNKVPQKSKIETNNQNYQVKIINMVLKLMPSKRCTPMEKYRAHLPPYLRISNRIGLVEFRHATNPNCVGCL